MGYSTGPSAGTITMMREGRFSRRWIGQGPKSAGADLDYFTRWRIRPFGYGEGTPPI
jgi:hypothetical protein